VQSQNQIRVQVDAQSCLRPWSNSSLIKSYSARYLLIGRCYDTLKKWKIHRGPVFDHQILKSTAELSRHWTDLKDIHQAQAVVPIPQGFSRSWQLGGSPTQKIAEWVSRETQLPLLPILTTTAKRTGSEGLRKRQAEMSFAERFTNPIRFRINYPFLTSKNLPRCLILVDDFFTTGHTLRQAAIALKTYGVQEIHTFCLGLRPARTQRAARTS
jgi:predicted amidophosphoribosyltransferase